MQVGYFPDELVLLVLFGIIGVMGDYDKPYGLR
jgi:hypothetical protein